MTNLIPSEPNSKIQISEQQKELWRRTYFRDATDDELAMFLAIIMRTGLSPEARQIFPVKRWDSKAKRETMSAQVSIDGYRLIAQRSGEYAGQAGPFWCGDDGKWKDIWTAKTFPMAAKVGVYRHGWIEPVWGVARFASYVQTLKDGSPNQFWKKMPDVMIAKVAEALALRKAFPNELSGLYTQDEMAQAKNPPKPIRVQQIDPEEKVRQVIQAFEPHHYELFGLEEALGRPCVDWDETDYQLLRNWLTQLNAGQVPKALADFRKAKSLAKSEPQVEEIPPPINP